MSMSHDITAVTPRNTKRTRKGRGEASKGKTSGRGGKGASARGGGPYWKRGHEGGQTSIFRRFPKRGFSNENFERRFYVVNLADLSHLEDGSTVDAASLVETGLVPDDYWPVKILGDGEVTKKLNITAGFFSKSALEKITKAGGKALNLKGEAFTTPKEKAIFVKRDKKKPAAAAEEAAAPAAEPKA